MSLPLCLAAKVLSIKIYLVEPNMVIGRANKFYLNFSEKLICYSKNLIKLPKKFGLKQKIIKPLIRKKYYETSFYKKDESLFALPRTMLGSIKKILIFNTLAAKHNGKDI